MRFCVDIAQLKTWGQAIALSKASRTLRVLASSSGLLFCLPLWADWTALGPFGGSCAIVAADPHSPGTFLVGTRNALLFRSRDGGRSWNPLPFPAKLQATLHTLVIDQGVPGVYLAGLTSDRPEYSGILRSTDGGATWQQVASLHGREVRAIATRRVRSPVMAAGTDTGVFQSRDGGATWSRISPADNGQLQPIVALAFDPQDSTTIFAGTPHLPWKTSDSGVTWGSVHSGMIDDSDVFSIQADRNRPQRVFAGACSGIYRSLDGGVTWTRLAWSADASDRTYTIVQHPQYENVWFAGTTRGMIKSANGGATWDRLVPFATRSIAFDPGRLGRILIATDQAGILRSEDDGKTWEQANRGFCNRRLTSLWTNAAGVVYTSTMLDPGDGGAFRLMRNSNEWESVVFNTSPPDENPFTIPVTSAPGSMSLSPDVRTGLAALLAPPWSPHMYVASFESGLFVSENAGRHWTRVDLPAAKARIRTLATLDAPWIAAAGAPGIFLSPDGKTWELFRPAGADGDVYDVVSTRGRRLLAATQSGLRASDDLGKSWKPVAGELGGDTIQALCRHPTETAVLFASSYGLIYTSPDGGHCWRRMAALPSFIDSVRQLTVVPGSPDRLFVLTPQEGVFAMELNARGSVINACTGSGTEPRP